MVNNMVAKLQKWSPKIMPTWLYHRDFVKFPLNRHYNVSIEVLHGDDLETGLWRGSLLQVVAAARERKSRQASELDKNGRKYNSSFFCLVDSGRFQRQDGSDRSKATADREDRLIVRSAVTVLDSSLSTIRRAARTRVYTMTIHRRLIERNLRSYRPLRHLPLMPAHCRARLQWC
ncbi:HTH_Tnp_Tc3_2 domain-containing protein [Trichonephila clavipes]|nr:HTH_Tnp_Tc3_2 domain-containing protein [Trichonephila clavipes]